MRGRSSLISPGVLLRWGRFKTSLKAKHMLSCSPLKSHAGSKPTPMMKQWWRVKEEHPECLVMIRYGDFYEMFHEDAVEASSILNITLTKRGTKKDDSNVIQMCGVRHDTLEQYLFKLVRHKVKVAVCDQISTSTSEQKGNTLVDRKVVRVATPGTMTEDTYLQSNENNFLVSLAFSNGVYGLARWDISTGEFMLAPLGNDREMKLNLARYEASEIVVPSYLLHLDCFEFNEKSFSFSCPSLGDCLVTDRDLSEFQRIPQFAESLVATEAEKSALAGLVQYVDYTQCGTASTDFSSSSRVDSDKSKELYIEPSALKNLELLIGNNGIRSHGLLHTIDRTLTGPGSRLLRRRIQAPSRDCDEINKRLDSVEFFHRNVELCNRAGDLLKRSADLQRAVQRCILRRADGRDLYSIFLTLQVAKEMKDGLWDGVSKKDGEIYSALFRIGDAYERLKIPVVGFIERAIHEDGGLGNVVIKTGFHEELDRQRKLKLDSRNVVRTLIEEYKETMNLKHVRQRLTRTHGYCIELPKSKVGVLPDEFLKIQELKSTVRFKTSKLIEIEGKILGASKKVVDIEKEIFEQLFELVHSHVKDITAIANALALIDVAWGLAKSVKKLNLYRPVVVPDPVLDIGFGRHLVVSENIKTDSGMPRPFVSNPVRLNSSDDSGLWMITGPNMGGKSTFLRQNAHIIVLAQLGSFVPAHSATVGLVDKLFCRVGASDELAGDKSTFMVEMEETARILSLATSQSFVIIDEVGRGTSATDGAAIAQAVLEALLELNCRTLFATHFHQLGALEGFQTYKMEFLENGEEGECSYLYSLKPGVAYTSHGVNVAKLAKLPDKVIERANQLLSSKKNVSSDMFTEKKLSQVVQLLNSMEVSSLKPTEMVDLLDCLKHYLNGLNEKI